MEGTENSFHTHGWRQALLRRCKGLPPISTAVAHPCDVAALMAAVEAATEGLITPILVGPKKR